MRFTRSGSSLMHPRSKGPNSLEPPVSDAGSFIALANASLCRRATAITRCPVAHSVLAIPSPRPRLPPVTMTLGIASPELAGCRDRQRRREANRGGDFVGGERPAAGREDLRTRALDRRGVGHVAAGQNNLGRHDRPGNRILARFDERHPHAGMPIDDGFDFLRMDLQTTDVDDPTASSDEEVSIFASLDDIAGVDETVRVAE